jgi:Amt family ammonium transporter
MPLSIPGSNSTVVPWLDTGNNAWQLTASTLVGLQSVPGLAILYAGVVKTKWAVNSAFMAFYAFAAVLAVLVLWAYKMGFGKQLAPFIGVPGPLMTIENELEQAILPASGITAEFPISTMAYFQFVFAAITVVIIAGAFLGRMNFLAWMIFVPLWVTFSYTVGAFSIWGGGFLGAMGVIDYSGGYVIHISSGTAGFVGAAWIGPRLSHDAEDFRPHNVLLTLIGAGFFGLGGMDLTAVTPMLQVPMLELQY